MSNTAMSEALRKRYQTILLEAGPDFEACLRQDTSYLARFSGLFLTSVPPVWEAGRRIMVVGRETKGWRVVGGHKPPYQDLEDYLDRALQLHAGFLPKALAGRTERKTRFFHVVRQISALVGSGNIAWANLFCLDWDRGGRRSRMPQPGDPTNYDQVFDVSGLFLKAAIEILEPDAIVFVNGKSSRNILHRHFPIPAEAGRQIGDSSADDLMGFKLEHAECYRTHHPRALRKVVRKALLSDLQSRIPF